MPVKLTIGCALAALLLLMTGGPRLSGQDPPGTQPPTTKSLKIVPVTYTQPDSGAQMFKEYCASCHGVTGKGDGPAVVFLKTPPPDLRTMAQRNKGKYPAAKVETMLRFGPGSEAHGALDMPTWGPIFRSLNPTSRAHIAAIYANPSGKTRNSQRPVPLLGESHDVLHRRWLEQGQPQEGWVFPSKKAPSGHMMTLHKAFQKARKAAGLPQAMCLYSARHGVGTDLAPIIGLKATMDVLGHADAKTALRYQHPDVFKLRAQLENARTNGRVN